MYHIIVVLFISLSWVESLLLKETNCCNKIESSQKEFDLNFFFFLLSFIFIFIFFWVREKEVIFEVDVKWGVKNYMVDLIQYLLCFIHFYFLSIMFFVYILMWWKDDGALWCYFSFEFSHLCTKYKNKLLHWSVWKFSLWIFWKLCLFVC